MAGHATHARTASAASPLAVTDEVPVLNCDLLFVMCTSTARRMPFLSLSRSGDLCSGPQGAGVGATRIAGEHPVIQLLSGRGACGGLGRNVFSRETADRLGGGEHSCQQ